MQQPSKKSIPRRRHIKLDDNTAVILAAARDDYLRNIQTLNSMLGIEMIYSEIDVNLPASAITRSVVSANPLKAVAENFAAQQNARNANSLLTSAAQQIRGEYTEFKENGHGKREILISELDMYADRYGDHGSAKRQAKDTNLQKVLESFKAYKARGFIFPLNSMS